MTDDPVLFDINQFVYNREKLQSVANDILKSCQTKYSVDMVQNIAIIYGIPCQWVLELIEMKQLNEGVTDE